MGVAVFHNALHFRRMKRRDDQITLRVAGQLRAALEDEAAAERRSLSNLIRKILIGHTAQRVTPSTSAETSQ